MVHLGILSMLTSFHTHVAWHDCARKVRCTPIYTVHQGLSFHKLAPDIASHPPLAHEPTRTSYCRIGKVDRQTPWMNPYVVHHSTQILFITKIGSLRR
jgi:hypothetical protein